MLRKKYRHGLTDLGYQFDGLTELSGGNRIGYTKDL